MEFVDYYKILGLAKNAAPEEIKNAYRKLARKHHPDLNPNDKEANKKFQELNEANEVLSDPDKRKKYDQYGKDWKHGEEFEKAKQQQRPTGNREGFDFGSGDDDSSDFFASMFGGGRSGSRGPAKFRGQDYNAELQLTLTDAYKTHQQTLLVNSKNIRITIPAGIENGQVIKLKGYGAPGMNGGPNGDLYITFSIVNDTRYKRLANDLHNMVEIDLYTAVLGGEVTIDTMDGKVKLKVNPGTQNGSKMKLKEKGFPVYKKEGEFGDMIITFNVKLPTSLTEKQKELFTELSKPQL